MCVEAKNFLASDVLSHSSLCMRLASLTARASWLWSLKRIQKCSYLLPAVLVLGSIEVRAAEPTVGMVTRVENEATIISGGADATALVGTVLHLKDELRTGIDARLEVTFRDRTTLTLGENATVVIDRYVFDPDQSVGEASIDAAKGAVRFATGQMKSLTTKNISVSTSVATLGVRGTDLWTGPFKRHYGALAVEPEVLISNQGGSVALSAAGQGTEIVSASIAPTAPRFWTSAEIAEALKTTDFQSPPTGPTEQPRYQPKQQRGGQNGQPGGGSQYALSGTPVIPAFLATLPLIGFVVSSQTDEDDPSSP
jgi:hypothetical protein